MTRLLWGLVLITSVIEIARAETWVEVDGRLRRLRSPTDCKRLGLGDAELACDCCLVSESNAIDARMANVLCVESQICPYSSSSFFYDQGAQARVAEARNRLGASSILPIGRLFPELSVPKDGVLTPEAVSGIIKAIHESGRIDLPAGVLPKDLLIKAVGKSAKGFYSGQLFLISIADGGYAKPLFFLKETKKGKKEIKNLYRIAASDLISEKMPIDPWSKGEVMRSDGMATIAFDEVHFKLKAHGRNRYFSLLQAAPGKSLHDHLLRFGELLKNADRRSPEFAHAIRRMEGMFFRIGHALSLLHQKYAWPSSEGGVSKTYIHGDMHSDNLFIDESTGLVTLIDNETFALSIKHRSYGIDDIIDLYLLHTVSTVTQKLTKQIRTNRQLGIDDGVWHELWYHLIKGYILAYGDIAKAGFTRRVLAMRKKFLQGYSQAVIFRSKKNLLDLRKLKRIGPSARRHRVKRQNLKPIFDRLLSDGLAA